MGSDSIEFMLCLPRLHTLSRIQWSLTPLNCAVCLEAYRAGRDEATDYVAIDAKGRVSGQFHGPPAVRFFDIGADYALGVHRDSDDVDTVVLYRISR